MKFHPRSEVASISKQLLATDLTRYLPCFETCRIPRLRVEWGVHGRVVGPEQLRRVRHRPK